MSRGKNILKHKTTRIIIIAGIQQDRGIGYQGKLLFEVKEDMKHFTEQTTNHTVIMGRKTWESIPKEHRPLKNRTNIVVTRDTTYIALGALVVPKFYQALEQAPSNSDIYIIGGGEIYKQALSYAHELDLTIFYSNKKADTFFPEYLPYFVEEESSEKYIDDKSNISYQFKKFLRK